MTAIDMILFFGWVGTSLATLVWCHFLGRWIGAVEHDLAVLRHKPRFRMDRGVVDV